MRGSEPDTRGDCEPKAVTRLDELAERRPWWRTNPAARIKVESGMGHANPDGTLFLVRRRASEVMISAGQSTAIAAPSNNDQQ